MTSPPSATASVDDACMLLARTPATLRELLHALPPDWHRANEGDGTWSPFDVVGHLIDADRSNWMTRVRQILADGAARPFADFDRFAHLQSAETDTLDGRLVTFARVRQASLDDLRGLGLGPGDLERTGLHPVFGGVTLGQLLATWVVHDLDHLMQISRVLARRYATAVGPWRSYLRIVRDVDAT